MIQLFFQNTMTTIATISLIAILAYMVISMKNTHKHTWGKSMFILGALALWLCIIVVMRDNYVATVQNNTGLFQANSFTIYGAYALITFMLITVIFTIFTKSQVKKKQLYYIFCFLIIAKIILIEGSRITL